MTTIGFRELETPDRNLVKEQIKAFIAKGENGKFPIPVDPNNPKGSIVSITIRPDGSAIDSSNGNNVIKVSKQRKN